MLYSNVDQYLPGMANVSDLGASNIDGFTDSVVGENSITNDFVDGHNPTRIACQSEDGTRQVCGTGGSCNELETAGYFTLEICQWS